MARERSRPLRSIQCRLARYAILPLSLVKRGKQRDGGQHPGSHWTTRLGVVGGRGAERGFVRRIHRVGQASLRSAFYPLHRDWLAARAGVLGPWIRNGGRIRGFGVWLS